MFNCADGLGLKPRHVRYQHDIVNAFYWGSETLAQARRLSPNEASANSWAAFARGYFTLYDQVQPKAYKSDYRLDYPPLRLLVMSIWARQVRNDFPGVDDGHPKHLKPLLNVNLACELISALAIFLLVRSWVRRSSGATHSSFLRGSPLQNRAAICGLAAASVAWLEPSMILDTHGWPQWDVWILPFYLFAVFAALKKRWFLCGCLLAAGAMLKGQLLLVVPFFVLWPLWQKRWTARCDCSRGLLDDGPCSFAVAFAHSNGVGLWSRLLVASVPCYFCRSKFPTRLGVGGRYDCSGEFRGWSVRRGQLCMAANWFSLRQRALSISLHQLDLQPAISSRQLGWSLKDSLWSYEFGSRFIAVTPQWILRLAYLEGSLSARLGPHDIGAIAIPGVLIAMATPWLLMFALLGQMHERYLMWGAVVSAVALGVSLRLSVVHFIISAISTAMIVHVMLVDKKLETTLRALICFTAVRSWLAWRCLWDTVSSRVPDFGGTSRAEEMPALPLGPAPEEVKVN